MSQRPTPRSLSVDAFFAMAVAYGFGWYASSQGDDGFDWSTFGPYFAGGLVAFVVLWAAAEILRVFSDDE